MRKQRIEVIKQLVATHDIRSQHELKEILAKEGFQVSQGSLSRDIQLLHLRKIRASNGKLIYALPGRSSQERMAQTDHVAGRGFLSIGFSHNVVVIKTRPGYAGGVASDIDLLAGELFLGSVAGDDTIILIPYEEVTREQLVEVLRGFLPIGNI